MNKKTYIKHQYFSVLIAYRSRNHTPSVQWFFWEGFRPQLVYQNVTIVTIRCIPLIAVPIGSMGLVYLPTNLASKIMVNISYPDIMGYGFPMKFHFSTVASPQRNVTTSWKSWGGDGNGKNGCRFYIDGENFDLCPQMGEAWTRCLVGGREGRPGVLRAISIYTPINYKYIGNI